MNRRAAPAIIAGEPPRATGAGISPATHLEAVVLEAWNGALGDFPVRRDADFFDEGGDSLAAVELVEHLEQELGADCIDIEDLVEGPTFDGIVQSLVRPGRQADHRRSSVVRFRRFESPAQPIVLAHVISGEVLFLRHVSPQALGRPVIGLRSRGLDGEEPPLRTVEAMASRYIDELRAEGIGPPYLIGGYSAGGLVAYEMAHQLERHGLACRLMLIDTVHPSPEERAFVDAAPSIDQVIRQMEHLYLLQLQNGLLQPEERTPLDLLFVEATATVPTEEDASRLAESLAHRGAIPAHWGLADLAAQAAVFAWNVVAVFTYSPPSYDGPVALLSAVPDAARAADETVIPNEASWAERIPQVEVHRAVGLHELLFWEGQAMTFLDRVTRAADPVP